MELQPGQVNWEGIIHSLIREQYACGYIMYLQEAVNLFVTIVSDNH